MLEDRRMAYELVREELEYWEKRKERLKQFLGNTYYSILPEDIREELLKRIKKEIEICRGQEEQLNSDLEQVLFCPKVLKGG